MSRVARRRRNPYGWQQARLKAFAEYERSDLEFYEAYHEKSGTRIPFAILSVMLFFQKEEYLRKPGSLVVLYRIANGEGGGPADFYRRYERYFSALKERGFL